MPLTPEQAADYERAAVALEEAETLGDIWSPDELQSWEYAAWRALLIREMKPFEAACLLRECIREGKTLDELRASPTTEQVR